MVHIYMADLKPLVENFNVMLNVKVYVIQDGRKDERTNATDFRDPCYTCVSKHK